MGNENVGLGVMGLAMKELFEKINEMQDTYNFLFSVSCLEVYNETIRYL